MWGKGQLFCFAKMSLYGDSFCPLTTDRIVASRVLPSCESGGEQITWSKRLAWESSRQGSEMADIPRDHLMHQILDPEFFWLSREKVIVALCDCYWDPGNRAQSLARSLQETSSIPKGTYRSWSVS